MSMLGLQFAMAMEHYAMPKKKAKKIKQKKFDSWFEGQNVSQLKELCRASKLPVSGSKGVLVQRLLDNKTSNEYSLWSNGYLKKTCKGRLLVQSGNKYGLVLRLLQDENGTGAPKRAATETTTNENGETVQVPKKRAKTILSPESMYNKIKQKIHAVKQKKYQTHYGSKSHAGDTYSYLKELVQSQCIASKLITSSPLQAYEMAEAAFRAFFDHWPYFDRPGYDVEDFKAEWGAMGKLEIVLKATRPHLSEPRIAAMIELLESIQASVRGYGLEIRNEHVNIFREEAEKLPESSCFVEAIKILRPLYDPKERPRKCSRSLYRDIRGVAEMNGLSYTTEEVPCYHGPLSTA